MATQPKGERMIEISKTALAPGLYLVSTPIGAARDITLRALDVLASADVIAAEDTRTARKLMDIHGIALNGRRIQAYHEHSGPKDRDRLVQMMSAGQSLAYVSEAGTPLVADPGFQLARGAHEAGVAVVPVPGASAVLAGLTISGLPSDRFLFAGFLPAASKARRKVLQDLAAVPATLVFYESPRRVSEMLKDCADILGENRPAALARELTKKFEECIRGPLSDLADTCAATPPRGECVVLVDRADGQQGAPADIAGLLADMMQDHSLKDAVALVVDMTGQPKREVYQQALALRDGG